MKTVNQMDQENTDYTARDLLVVLFKNKNCMIAVFILVITVAAIMILITQPVYEAKAILLVKGGNQGGINNSEIQILTSKNSIRKVITTIRLEAIYPDLANNPPAKVDRLEVATLRFQKELQAQRLKDSGMIEVSFRNGDPKVAARVVNLLVEYFKQQRLQLFSEGKSAFNEAQLALHQAKLQEYEKLIHSYKQKTELYSAEDQRKQLLEQLSAGKNETNDTMQRIVQLENRIPVLRARNQKLKDATARKARSEQEQMLYEAKLKLVNMQMEEEQLLMKYREATPKVKSFRKQMQLISDFIAEQEKALAGKGATVEIAYQNAETELIDAETELRSQKVKLQALRQESQKLGEELRALEQTDGDLQRLTRELSATEKVYQSYLTKVEEARISEDAERRKLAGISVLQEATPPLEPVEPNVTKALGRGAILALAAGLAVVLLSEFLDQSLATPQAAERRLGLRVLLTVPRRETGRRAGWLSCRASKKKELNGDAAGDPGSAAALAAETGDAEARFSTDRDMQELYRSLEYLLSAGATKIILFTGPKGGEGVSSMVREFAATAARLHKKRVLILDAAHCNPSQHIHFRIDPNHGWIDAFRNKEPLASACYTLDHPTLFLSPICSQPTLSPWCNEEASSTAFFRELKSEFDYILIDSSPVLTSPDCATICRFCDGVIMVMETATNWRVADSARRKIVENDGTILGVAFNKRRFYIPGRIYKVLS